MSKCSLLCTIVFVSLLTQATSSAQVCATCAGDAAYKKITLFGAQGVCAYVPQAEVDIHTATNPSARWAYGQCANAPRSAGFVGLAATASFLTGLSGTNDFLMVANDTCRHLRIANNSSLENSGNICFDLTKSGVGQVNRMTLYRDGKIDFNVGNWNCQTGMIRFQGESWDGSSSNVEDPVVKLYRPTGTSTACPSPLSYTWWIQNAGSSGGDNSGSLQFRALPTSGTIGSETVSTMQTRMIIQRDGNVGINTLSPVAKLHVHDGSVLFDGSTGSTPTSGAGTRLMWIPSKYSLRAGEASGSEWDNTNIGDYSFGLGLHVMVSGSKSVAVGEHHIVAGHKSAAFGSTDTVSSVSSFALGSDCKVETDYALAVGLENQILVGSAFNPGCTFVFGRNCVARDQAYYAFAGGNNDTVTVQGSIALGLDNFAGNVASGSHCGTAIGHHCSATGTDALSVGLANVVPGNYSAAIGNYDTVSTSMSVGIGTYLQTTGGTAHTVLLGSGYNQTHNLIASGGNRVEIGVRSALPTVTIVPFPDAVTTSNYDSVGFVGLGETSPNNRLEVRGGVVIGSSNYTGGEIDMTLFTRKSNRLIVEDVVQIGSTDFYDYTATPDTVMDRDYSLYVHGDYFTDGTHWTTSDSTLKTNIEPYKLGLAEIRQIRPVKFVWKCDTCSQSQMPEVGVIAQELHMTLPLATRVDSWKSMHMIDSGFTETVVVPVADSSGHQEYETTIHPPKYEMQSMTRWAIRPTDIMYTLVNAAQELDSSQTETKALLATTNRRTDSLQTVVGNQRLAIDSLRAMVTQLFALAANSTENSGVDNLAWLMQNVPNPVSTTTEISCWVSDQVSEEVVLRVTNLQNMKVYFATPIAKGSTQVIALDRSSFDAGPYMYCLETASKVMLCKKMFVNP